jgi:quercetin dioxygenase-like cupin family protein
MDPNTRLIRRQDMVACKLAFIDCKMPGSDTKENYSLIGAGVTQSADQVVNITEPHGFSLGVAAMPPGTTNNLHVHYTAEVFMVFSGTWLFRWGAEGRDGEIIGRVGDVVSIPTWIFRGFSNVGDENGWIFTALGGDDTGGIIWHPSILRNAAEHGLYLTKDNMLVDTEAGAAKPAAEALIEPLDPATIEGLRRFDVAAMRRRVVTAGERAWSERALLDSVLPGHAARLAPVIGHGMSQDLEQAPPIANPHGFSVEWLRIAPGQSVGPFRLAEKQVLLVFAGAIEITLDEAAAVRAEAQEVFSVPGGAWRLIASVGDAEAELAVLTAGDQKKHPVWGADIVAAAAAAGLGVDHAGYLAPLKLLPHEVQSRAA